MPFREVLNIVDNFPIDLTKVNNLGRTPLATACWSAKNVEGIKILARHTTDAELEQQDNRGSTALHYLLKTKEKQGLQDLVTKHHHCIAKCTVRDEKGHIPLVYAPEWISEPSVARDLIYLAGDNIGTRGDDGRDVMYRACECGANAIIAALIDHDVDIDKAIGSSQNQDTTKDTIEDEPRGCMREPPLIIAARAGQIDTVKLHS